MNGSQDDRRALSAAIAENMRLKDELQRQREDMAEMAKELLAQRITMAKQRRRIAHLERLLEE